MLQTYQAEVNGSELIWIDPPPAPLAHRRVVVVVEDAPLPSPAASERVQAFLRARGCLGRAGRQQVLEGLVHLREDWSRNPLGAAGPG